jgi:hypothetical protein
MMLKLHIATDFETKEFGFATRAGNRPLSKRNRIFWNKIMLSTKAFYHKTIDDVLPNGRHGGSCTLVPVLTFPQSPPSIDGGPSNGIIRRTRTGICNPRCRGELSILLGKTTEDDSTDFEH